MSLINDALKRARDADRQRGAAPPDMRLQPVEPPANGRHASRWPVLALVLAALALSLWSFSRWARTTPAAADPELAAAPRISSPAEITPPTNPADAATSLPASPAPAATTEPMTVTPDAAPGAQVPDSAPDSASHPAPAVEPPIEPPPTNTPTAEPATPPAAAAPPELRLQSIIFRLRNPAVVINGQMLHKGDSIAGARIIEIERHRVTLDGKETNLVLTLPDY